MFPSSCHIIVAPTQVVIGDKVVLTQVNSRQPLHVSHLYLPDHPVCLEVNADPIGSSWKICLFMKHEEDKLDVLKGVGHYLNNYLNFNTQLLGIEYVRFT